MLNVFVPSPPVPQVSSSPVRFERMGVIISRIPRAAPTISETDSPLARKASSNCPISSSLARPASIQTMACCIWSADKSFPDWASFTKSSSILASGEFPAIKATGRHHGSRSEEMVPCLGEVTVPTGYQGFKLAYPSTPIFSALCLSRGLKYRKRRNGRTTAVDVSLANNRWQIAVHRMACPVPRQFSNSLFAFAISIGLCNRSLIV